MPDTTISPAEQAVDRDKRGRFLPGTHAGVTTRFEPGQSGNPNGRPCAGLAIIEWVNILQNASEDEVRSIADDAAAPLNKRIAATRLLATLYADDPTEARKSASFVVDYTHGRPVQTQMVLQGDGRTPQQLLRELKHKLGLPDDVDLKAVRQVQSVAAPDTTPLTAIEKILSEVGEAHGATADDADQ